MANESLSFFCPACGIKLTVPSSMAGVVGPCPSCRTQIQAPVPAPPLPVASFAPPVSVPIPVPTPQAAQAAAAVPVYQPPPVTAPPVSYPPVDPAALAAATQPVVLKPEPRNLPSRPHPEVVAKPIPESTRGADSKVPPPAPLPRHPHKTNPIARVAFLLVFLAAAAALVFAVHQFLNMDRGAGTREARVLPDKQPPAPEVPAAATQPSQPGGNTPPPAPQENPPALPTPTPDQTPVIDPPPAPPEGIDPATPGIEAREVLEKFLAAKSLTERLPLIETRTPEAELANSCLATPLPPAPLLIQDFQETNGIENLVDFYFIVGFEKGSTPIEKLTVLVRSRGGGEPKVVVDPFLDLFGGRLAAFVSKPTEKAGVFHVIADPIATCLDKGMPIPDREKKFTLKLLPCENTKEIALAYFGKASEIGETFSDVSRGLGLGKAKACTVMLSWNLNKDDPANPFIEAIQLKALDWNP